MNDFNILIAGTSNSYLEISKKMLKFHYDRCTVDFAHSGRECVEKVLSNRYDLVLFDYDLGDQQGDEVAKTIRDRDPKVPLVLLVEEGEEAKAGQALEKGASDYIVKVRGYLTALPFTVRNILEREGTMRTKRDIPARATVRRRSEEGLLILDRKGRILSASRDMEHITHYTEDELLELNLVDLLPKEAEKAFYDWLNLINNNGQSVPPFKAQVLDKTGERVALDIELTAIKDENEQILSYRGTVRRSERASSVARPERGIDQLNMVAQVSRLITTSYEEPLSVLLERLVETACQVFSFQRGTLALLDKRRKMFVKQATVGYSADSKTPKTLEVPQEVVDRIFEGRFRVKALYYGQPQRSSGTFLNAAAPERRTQERRPPNQWHVRDLVLVNLANRNSETFGYLCLDNPVGEQMPTRDTFHNLELFGQLAAMAIENFYQFSTLERRTRRLKQVLVTSNIFKLYLSLSDLLKEVVWSIKFSLDFNLVALGLISKKSGRLEMKAVACDDKIKTKQLLEHAVPLEALSGLLRSRYRFGKSYLVLGEEDALRPIKYIYYGAQADGSRNGNWPPWGMLLVPIKSRDGKIIGMVMADDPANNKLPNKELTHVLEIMANQVGVAIDNRIMYVQAKKRPPERDGKTSSEFTLDSDSHSGFRRLVHRLFL
ncbi:MAG: response regulator [Calditrichaeota bacterium]|nr:MAG: response regulator [Calditrichota bacterium]